MKGFNINSEVWVRLTDHGKKIHEDHYNKYAFGMYEYKPPKEDADGWSKWQLWELMGVFGEHCYLGSTAPFETTIRLDIE